MLANAIRTFRDDPATTTLTNSNEGDRIDDGEVLGGEIPRKQLRLVQAWVEIHRDELLADDWELAIAGEANSSPAIRCMMLLDVVRVEPKQNHVLLLQFDNGERRQFDMAPYLKKPPFWSLSDAEVFAKASVAYGTVVWPGEIDISPDTLYDKSVPLTE